MTKKKNRKFAQIQIKMGMSQSWLTLNNPGYKVITYVLFKLIHENIGTRTKPIYVCSNKNEIQILYGELTEPPYNMQRKSITRGIDELLARGFIKVIEQGGSKKGHASIYGICDDYLKWKPGDDPINVRRPYSKRGFCAKPNDQKDNK